MEAPPSVDRDGQEQTIPGYHSALLRRALRKRCLAGLPQPLRRSALQ
jgi:hypothetical protein